MRGMGIPLLAAAEFQEGRWSPDRPQMALWSRPTPFREDRGLHARGGRCWRLSRQAALIEGRNQVRILAMVGRFELGAALGRFADIRMIGPTTAVGGGSNIAQRLTQPAKSAAQTFQQGFHPSLSGDEVVSMKPRHGVSSARPLCRERRALVQPKRRPPPPSKPAATARGDGRCDSTDLD